MSKSNNHLTMTSRRLPLIFAFIMMVTVRLVRPDDLSDADTADSLAALYDGADEFDSDATAAGNGPATAAVAAISTGSQEDRGVEIYLNAIRELQAMRDKQKGQVQLESPASYVLSKRQEAAPVVVSTRPGSVSALYRRSALNKNFIRFGRSGYKPRQNQPSSVINHRLIQTVPDSSDSSDLIEDRAQRSSRSLNSNFIRFGRSFYPSKRWAETTRRFARTSGRRMSLVDSDAFRSGRLFTGDKSGRSSSSSSSF